MAASVKVIRIRLVGRRWKLGFLVDLTNALAEKFGRDTLTRINSFIAQRSRMPLTDIDIFNADEQVVREVRRIVEEALERHGYPFGRLLTIKIVEVQLESGEASGQQ